VDQQCSAEVGSSLYQVFSAKVVFSKGALVIAAETAFHRKDVCAPKLIKQGHSRCRLFVFLVAESRIVINEEGADAREDERKKPRLFGSVLNIAPVHKDIFPATVAVVVTKQSQFSFLCRSKYKLFCVVYFRMQDLRGRLPPSIQVAPSKTAPVVAIYNAIWIEHRDDFEDKILPQQLCLLAGGVAQKIKRALHHPGTN